MPYQPQPPMDANNTPGLAPRAQLPQNIEAEQSVLAACLLNGEVTEEAVMRLRPENFFRPAHRIIFEAIISLTNRHIPVDPIALADTLKSTGQLEAVGGRAYLAELADNTFSLTSWERHVDIVKRQSILRELVFAATQINALAYDAPDDLDQVVEEAEKTLFNVTEKRVSSSFRKMDELVSDAYEEISRLANQKDKMAGVPTGFKDVDELFHGFRGGDLVILAARPGVGKTSFALNLATNAAKAGRRCGVLLLGDGRRAAGSAYPVLRGPRESLEAAQRIYCRGRLGRFGRSLGQALPAGHVHRRHPGPFGVGGPR